MRPSLKWLHMQHHGFNSAADNQKQIKKYDYIDTFIPSRTTLASSQKDVSENTGFSL